MFEYIVGLLIVVFLFVMISLRNINDVETFGDDNQTTPIIRIMLFIIVCIAYTGVGLESRLIRMDINVIYERFKILPLFMGSLFYFIDYYKYSENKDDIKLAQLTLENAFKNQIIFVILVAFVLVSHKIHFIEKVLGVLGKNIMFERPKGFMILKGIFYPHIGIDTNMVLAFLKAAVLIGSFLFYATYYIIYFKDKDNIALAQKTLKLARINHFACVALLAGILYYEYIFEL